MDTEANLVLWRGLSEMPLRLVDGPGDWVADLGGGNANFVRPLAGKGARLLSIDVDANALRGAPVRGARPVRGTALALPVADGALDAIAGRAVLHHVPEALDDALREVHRVVKPRGLVLFQEPTSGNWIANTARRRFPTDLHDPHERPLPYEAYIDAVARRFEILEAGPHFLLAYLMPHLAARIPEDRRGPVRRLTRALDAWDRRLLRALPRLRGRAAYVSVLARRRG